MTKATNTTETKTTTTSYIPKLIINGQVIDQRAKQVTCNIKGTDVTLNCTYITDIELKDAYTSSFKITSNGKEIEVVYVKIDNRVSATIHINKVLAFSSLSMQAVFTVLNTAYGISKSHLNNLYIKSNSLRKQTSKASNQITVNNTFEF
jgi:hypothetical protein